MKKIVQLLLINFLVLSCSPVFYQPDSFIYSNPSQFGLTATNHFVDVDADTRIHIREFFAVGRAPGKEDGIVVFLHGNAQNMTSHIVQVQWLAKSGYRLFMPDYRGFGLSKGKSDQQGVLEDSRLALKMAIAYKQQYPHLKLILWGQSLGGAIALPLAATSDNASIDLLILDSTFDDYRYIAFDRLTSNPFTFLFSPLAYLTVSNEWAPKHFYPQLTSLPLWVIHSTGDQVIPYSFGETIYQRYLGPKEFLRFERYPHINILIDESNQLMLTEKLKKYFQK